MKKEIHKQREREDVKEINVRESIINNIFLFSIF